MKPGDIIFLSASVPYRPGWQENARPREIQEAIVSLSRAVFARGGRLLFGGHPSVSPLISSVAGEYIPVDPNRPYRVRPVITFQSKFFEGRLPDETWDLHRMGWASIQWTDSMAANEKETEQEASLRKMREWMLLGPKTPRQVIEAHALEAPPRGMVAVGGMEGVRDEAAMFLKHRKKWNVFPQPDVYAFSSAGGAAAQLLGRLRKEIEDGELIVDIEERWWSENGGSLSRDLPFQPYAAMTQWLADRLS